MDEALRDFVRQRAANRCEYCGLPAEYTEAPFQLDHIIAEKHHGPTVEGTWLGVAFTATASRDRTSPVETKSPE